MSTLLKQLTRRTEAQDIIEYSMLGAFISVCAMLALMAIGADVTSIYGDVDAVVTVVSTPSTTAPTTPPGGGPPGGGPPGGGPPGGGPPGGGPPGGGGPKK